VVASAASADGAHLVGGINFAVPGRRDLSAGGRTRAIGEELCRELAQRFQATLVILGRGALDEKRRQRCATIEQAGGRVHYYAVDVADRSALLQAGAPDSGGSRCAEPGVLQLAASHGAGLLAQTGFGVVRAKRSARTWPAPVDLEVLTAGDPLDFFVQFSSGLGLLAFVARRRIQLCVCVSRKPSSRASAHRVARARRARRRDDVALLGPMDGCDPIHAAADPRRAGEARRQMDSDCSAIAVAFPGARSGVRRN